MCNVTTFVGAWFPWWLISPTSSSFPWRPHMLASPLPTVGQWLHPCPTMLFTSRWYIRDYPMTRCHFSLRDIFSHRSSSLEGIYFPFRAATNASVLQHKCIAQVIRCNIIHITSSGIYSRATSHNPTRRSSASRYVDALACEVLWYQLVYAFTVFCRVALTASFRTFPRGASRDLGFVC